MTLVETKHTGTHDYAGFKSYRRLRLQMKDEEGRELEIATGSVGEIDGRFKFISFLRD